MWSEIAIRRPGPTSARSEPAALVTQQRLGAELLEHADRHAHRARVAALVDVLAALEDRDREAVELAHVQRAAVARDGRLREAVELGVREPRGVRERVGEPAQTGAEDDPEPRREVLEASHSGRNSGPKERGQQRVERRRLARAVLGADVDLGAGHDELAQPLAAAAAGHAEVLAVGDHRDLGDLLAARGDQRADRGRLRALALRVGGVLDVGADVDRAVLGAQRGADAVAAVRARGRAPSRPWRLRPGRWSRRPGRSRSCAGCARAGSPAPR